MAVDRFIERERPFWGGALAGLYVRVLLYFLLLMLALWVVGIEGIYSHPTPFYAMLWPAFSSPLAPLLALLAAGGVYVVTRFMVFAYSPQSRFRAGLGYGLWIAGLVAAGVLMGRAALVEGANPAAVLFRQWPDLKWHLLVVAVFSAFFALWWWLVLHARWFVDPMPTRTRRWFLFGLFAFLFCFSGAVAMLRDGPTGIAQAYHRESLEYIGDIGKGLTIRGLFRDYTSIHELLSVHAKVHPPGPIVLLWLGSYVAGRSALALSLFTMAAGSAAVFPLFYWVRDMIHERAAATAAMLFTLMPSVVLFNATSADIMFLPFVLTTLFCFWRAIHRPSMGYAAIAGIGYACMSLLSFSLLAIGAFFGFVGLWRMAQGHWRSVVAVAAVMLAALLAVHGAVWLWSGFDVVETFRLSKAQFDEDQLALDIGAPRFPSWLWKFANPMAWFYFAGIPVSVLLVWRLWRPGQSTKVLFIIFALTLIVLDLLYLARGEGERSALYIMPFMLVPAAHLLDEMGAAARSYKPIMATILFLALQCWATETFFYTYW